MVWIAEYSSRHFDFQLVGGDEGHARRAMWLALVEYGRDRGLDESWFDADSINVGKREAGVLYRDGMALESDWRE